MNKNTVQRLLIGLVVVLAAVAIFAIANSRSTEERNFMAEHGVTDEEIESAVAEGNAAVGEENEAERNGFD